MSTIALGKITTETSDQYHATDAVSASKLRVFRRKPGGPQLYYQRFVAKMLEDEDSDAKAEGRAAHTMLFEPHKFAAEIAVLPEDCPDRPTKKMREAKRPSPESIARVAWWDNWDAETKGKTVLKTEQLRKLATMVTNARNHPAAAILLAKGEAEVSWRIKASGLRNLPPLQCRTDWFNPEGCALSEGRPYVVDLKTAATLEEDAFSNFQRSFEEHAYHCQAALYMAILSSLGIECRDFFFIAPEKIAPYGVEVHRLGDRALERGQTETERQLLELDECYRRNIWPNASLEVQELKLSPRYYARRNEEFAA
jgi:hypothetical protein